MAYSTATQYATTNPPCLSINLLHFTFALCEPKHTIANQNELSKTIMNQNEALQTLTFPTFQPHTSGRMPQGPVLSSLKAYIGSLCKIIQNFDEVGLSLC